MFLSARNSLGRVSSRILKRSAYSILEEYRRDQGYWSALSEGKKISGCHLVFPDHVRTLTGHQKDFDFYSEIGNQ